MRRAQCAQLFAMKIMKKAHLARAKVVRCFVRSNDACVPQKDPSVALATMRVSGEGSCQLFRGRCGVWWYVAAPSVAANAL